MAVEQRKRIGSILVVDCGTVTTKAMLLDRVAGQYRLVAHGESPTTTKHPWGDVTSGIRHAIEQLANVTGRQFFDGSGNLISPEMAGRQGVDAFAATTSAGEPLYVVLGGLTRDLSIASARRAVAGTYSKIQAILGNEPSEPLSDEARVHAIRDAAPDVVCIAGGTDSGAVRPILAMVEAVTLACSMLEFDERPQLLYMGNPKLRQRVANIVGEEAELHISSNVRPTLDHEFLIDAQNKLEELYVQHKMAHVPGINTVTRWGAVPPTPTARAFGRLMQYLWHLGDPGKGVLGVDVGAANTTVAAVFDEELYLTVHGDLGTVFGGERLLKKYGSDALIRWLPEAVSSYEARGWLINKQMHPISIPQVEQELWLEQALAREVIRATLKIARPGWRTGDAQPYPDLLPFCDTIVVSGGALTHSPQPGQAALIALDAVEPIGVSTLVLDKHGLAPALGSLAAVKPLAAVEALDGGGFVNLGTVVTPVGSAHPGDTVLKVKIVYDDESELEVEVNYGSLEVLPLPPGQEAVVELHPQRRFDVGLGGPGKSGKRRVSGGTVGLIIDARGRPLSIPHASEQRHEQMQQWLWDVGG